MTIIGRLLVRKGKTAGLFIPFTDKTEKMEEGIYELREVLGEITIVRIGKPAMPSVRYNARAVGELLHCPSAAMTAKELTGLDEYPRDAHDIFG